MVYLFEDQILFHNSPSPLQKIYICLRETLRNRTTVTLPLTSMAKWKSWILTHQRNSKTKWQEWWWNRDASWYDAIRFCLHFALLIVFLRERESKPFFYLYCKLWLLIRSIKQKEWIRIYPFLNRIHSAKQDNSKPLEKNILNFTADTTK